MNPIRLFALSIAITITFTSISAQRMTKAEYISTYKDLAIADMKTYGIPASITLAQGLFESDEGNSPLTVKSNNHFGIKCHSGWKGETVTHDDDHPGECFRKYPSATDSYNDHSALLAGSKRYAELFKLDPTDYKGWAYGLRKCGYATNPKYPELLIKVIEDNQLYLFDDPSTAGKPDLTVQDTKKTTDKKTWKPIKNKDVKKTPNKPSQPNKTYGNEPQWEVSLARHMVDQRNEVDYIIAKEGDTQESLTKEFDLFSWQLKSYNDFTDEHEIKAGDIIYLQPKRRYAARGNETHIVKSGETMLYISQLYGLKLNRLYHFNHMEKSDIPTVGDTLWLRESKPRK